MRGTEVAVHAIVGDPQVIEAAATALLPPAAQAGVRRVVYLSTASVHGQNPAPGTSEESTLRNQQDAHTTTPRCAPSALSSRDVGRYPVELIVLRPSIVFGPRDLWLTTLFAELEAGTAWLIDREGRPKNYQLLTKPRRESLGPVKRFQLSEGGPFNWPAQSESFFKRSHSSGGVLADVGVHVLDLLIWCFGMPEKVVYQDDAMSGLEANCLVELEFAGGISGTVRLSSDTRLANCTTIECERGWLRAPAASADQLEIGFSGVPYSVVGLNASLKETGFPGMRSTPAPTYQQSFSRQLQNVISAVHGEEALMIPGGEGLPSMRLIERCYRERTLMPMPWLGDFELSEQTGGRAVA